MNKRIEDIDITQESVDDFLRSPEIKRLLKVFKHTLRGYKPIKRTRKRQIAKAKHMMACHDQQVMTGKLTGWRKNNATQIQKNSLN